MYRTGIESVGGVWWKPAHRTEKVWIAIAFAWCLILFAMMPLWHIRGGQNPAGIRHRVDPADFRERTNEFIATYQVGTDQGIPVVQPPPGSDIYLMGMMWQWRPILRLEAGAEYILHLSSMDINHGFNLYPFNINFQVVPGYDYGLRIVPSEPGDFRIVCNEFCGVGHHMMVGRIIVVEPGAPAFGMEEGDPAGEVGGVAAGDGAAPAGAAGARMADVGGDA